MVSISKMFLRWVSVISSGDDSYTIVERLWQLGDRDAALMPDFWLNNFLVRQSLPTLLIWVEMWDLTNFWVFPK